MSSADACVCSPQPRVDLNNDHVSPPAGSLGDGAAMFYSVNALQLEPPSGSANMKAKNFRFNVLFEPEATQEDVISHSGS